MLVMAFSKIIAFAAVSAALLNLVTAVPDSAGIVEMEEGLAYGGIPYGSVTGMVAKYMGPPRARAIPYHGEPDAQLTPHLALAEKLKNSLPLTRGPPSVVVPVQIFNHPGVVAPGVVRQVGQFGLH